jgi:hypothetical protein
LDGLLVFFGGTAGTAAVGLGGSMTHVLGVVATSSRTHSHSATPILLDYLRKKLELHVAVSECQAAKRFFGEGEDSALSAVALAVKSMDGPEVEHEFLAKTQPHGEISDQFVLGPKRVMLGTPLCVAYATATTSGEP